MSTRPYVSFQQVKERCSLPEVLERFGVAEGFVRRGETLTGACPLPGHPVNRAGGQRNAQQFKVTRKDGV